MIDGRISRSLRGKSLLSTMLAQCGNETFSWVKCLLIFTILVNCFVVSNGCYLRNCPLGKWEGKRSEATYNQKPLKLCPACGTGNKGRCMGPSICCAEEAGCLVGKTAFDVSSCSREDDDPAPCKREGKTCGENGEGICGTDGVCCTEDACRMSEECEIGVPAVVNIMKILRGEY